MEHSAASSTLTMTASPPTSIRGPVFRRLANFGDRAIAGSSFRANVPQLKEGNCSAMFSSPLQQTCTTLCGGETPWAWVEYLTCHTRQSLFYSKSLIIKYLKMVEAAGVGVKASIYNLQLADSKLLRMPYFPPFPSPIARYCTTVCHSSFTAE
jgi:hypothetical protein